MLVLLCTQLQSLSFLITNRPLFVHFYLGTIYTPISIYVAWNYFHFMWWCRECPPIYPVLSFTLMMMLSSRLLCCFLVNSVFIYVPTYMMLGFEYMDPGPVTHTTYISIRHLRAQSMVFEIFEFLIRKCTHELSFYYNIWIGHPKTNQFPSSTPAGHTSPPVLLLVFHGCSIIAYGMNGCGFHSEFIKWQ